LSFESKCTAWLARRRGKLVELADRGKTQLFRPGIPQTNFQITMQDMLFFLSSSIPVVVHFGYARFLYPIFLKQWISMTGHLETNVWGFVFVFLCFILPDFFSKNPPWKDPLLFVIIIVLAAGAGFLLGLVFWLKNPAPWIILAIFASYAFLLFLIRLSYFVILGTERLFSILTRQLGENHSLRIWVFVIGVLFFITSRIFMWFADKT
jgi:hypothetical protein